MVSPSVRASLFRLDVLNLVCAFGLGGLVFRKWRSSASKWVWIAGLCWFCQGIVSSSDHVVSWEAAATKSVMFLDEAAIASWILYTLFSIRVVSYSAGAWFGFLVGALWDRQQVLRKLPAPSKG